MRTNNSIRASEVLVILPDASTQGPIQIQQALQLAQDLGLDLVEVSPNAKPPVCKVLDYGKYKYEISKKNKGVVKKKQLLKEIRMQPKISDHDLKFKTNHVQQFLQEGHKVKVTIRFKGRELAHLNIGEDILKNILTMITCNFSVDKDPSLEGRNMSMILSPSSKKSQSSKKTFESSLGDANKNATKDQKLDAPNNADAITNMKPSEETIKPSEETNPKDVEKAGMSPEGSDS